MASPQPSLPQDGSMNATTKQSSAAIRTSESSLLLSHQRSVVNLKDVGIFSQRLTEVFFKTTHNRLTSHGRAGRVNGSSYLCPA